MGFNVSKAWKKTKKAVKSGWKATGHALDPMGLVTGDPLFGGGGGQGTGEIDSQFAQAQQKAGLGAARALSINRRALGETRRAFQGARTGFNAGRANSIQYAEDAGAQAGANAQQSLTDRGLGNTTIVDNARQGISSGVSRAVADINSNYDQLLAQLGIGEAQATTGIRARMAASAEDLGRLQSGLHAQQANLYASLDHEDPNEWLDSLLNIGSTAIGYGIGKSF